MNIHFIGIEGVSMRALAKIMQARGAVVTGSDITTTGHDERNVYGADIVVYTCAVGKNNVELQYAKKHMLPTYERAEFLGKLSEKFSHVVAVGGSHGKTTTTGMLGKIFEPLNATVHIGGITGGECGHAGGDKYFITEACEYKRNFLHIKPEVAIALNVELDHTDYYADLADIKDAFYVFANSARVKIINGDDINSSKLLGGNCITFGIDKGNMYHAQNIRHSGKGYIFDVVESGRTLGEIRLALEGKHNIYNALASVAAARCYGINFNIIKNGLEEFNGAKRRFEKLGFYGGATIFSDYAHHPSELKASISSARDAGYEKVIIVFEPHTYSRTKSLLNEFASVLAKADEVILAPIFAAREAPMPGVSSGVLCRKLLDNGAKVTCFSTFYEVIARARAQGSQGAAIIFAGAGNIDVAAHLLVNEDYLK